MDSSKLEFLCPYCKEFVLKSHGESHLAGHQRIANIGEKFPVTLEELEQRFVHLGYWEEK